jgi:heme/copper-type cytochrome/quinol oxidase subunit 2
MISDFRLRIADFKFKVAALAVLLTMVVLVVPVPLTRRLTASWGLAAPQERHVRIEASQFQFTPPVISVNPGDRVTIDLTTTDVVHGLYVDDYGVNITADPGQTTRLTFVADKAGTFALRCFAPCGPLHPFMVGKLNVGPNWLLWRAMGIASVAAFAGFWMIRK